MSVKTGIFCGVFPLISTFETMAYRELLSLLTVCLLPSLGGASMVSAHPFWLTLSLQSFELARVITYRI